MQTENRTLFLSLCAQEWLVIGQAVDDTVPCHVPVMCLQQSSSRDWELGKVCDANHNGKDSK